MDKILFMVDTLADLPKTLVASRIDIEVINIPIILTKPGKQPLELNNLDADSFEKADEFVQTGWRSNTSLPILRQTEDEEKYGIKSVERATRAAMSEGYNVLYLAVNSAISGSYGAIAKLYDEINEDSSAPAGKIAIAVDTKCAGTGIALLLDDLLQAYDRREIDTISEAESYIVERRDHIGMLFTWLEFEYVKKSGKVSAISAALGKTLHLHPLGSVEYINANDRPLITIAKAIHGWKKFRNTLVRFIKATIEDPTGIIIVAHGKVAEKAEELAAAIRINLPEATVLCNEDWRCGPAIQAHGGPTSLHINYHRKTPNNYEESVQICKQVSS